MATTKFTCRRSDCNSTLKAADEETQLRCNLCGTTHRGPWDSPTAETPVPDTVNTASRQPDGTVACTSCGTAFDPDREPPRRGMDTSRCPSCGEKHELEGTEAGNGVSATATDGGEARPVASAGFDPEAVAEAVIEGSGDGVEIHLHTHEHHHH